LDDDQDGGCVSVSSGTGSPRWSRTNGRKTVVVVVVIVVSLCLTCFILYIYIYIYIYICDMFMSG